MVFRALTYREVHDAVIANFSCVEEVGLRIIPSLKGI